jgi:lincosamide nucleotidyltransferase A/C/D/E
LSIETVAEGSMVTPVGGMALAEVMRVLRALEASGVRYWLEGGWGVDALAGRQTRPHRDLDIDLDATQEALAVSVLEELGYTIDEDWRPNRVDLVAADRGRVDLHPLAIDQDGSARQAALEGGHYLFPLSYFTVGQLNGHPVPCVTREAQMAFREGYELRASDRHDLELLEAMRGPAVDSLPRWVYLPADS